MSRKFLRGVFTIMLSAIILISTVGQYQPEKASADAYEDVSGYESIAKAYEGYFKVGAACEAIDHWGDKLKEIGNPSKELAISSLFNSITCGNEMKPAYNFSASNDKLFSIDHAAAEMMQWAKDNGVAMRGHTLVWHGQVDPSIFAIDFKAYSDGKITRSDSAQLDETCLVDRETLIERLRTYIYSMIEYTYANGYADVIYSWDVVNEAIDEGTSDGLRRSYWYKIIGPEFLYYSFLFAREAQYKYSKEYAGLYGLDPEKDDLSPIIAKLVYNDYNEWFTQRVNIAVKTFTETKFNENHEMVKSDAIRPDGDGTIFGDGLIDAFGMQGHLSDNQDINTYIKALKKYSDAVGEVQITELDVGCTSYDENQWFKQAQFYYDFFKALKQAVDEGANLTTVTLWGLTDDASWRSSSYPLLLNGDLSRKPAYEAVVMAGKGQDFDIDFAKTITNLKDKTIDFEPYKENEKTVVVDLKKVGILERGSGHQPQIAIVAKVNHTETAKIGYSLKVTRGEQDANVMLDVSKYAGRNITLTAYAKTQDSYISAGIDGDEPILLARKYTTSPDEWVKLEFNTDVPENSTVFIYFETDGNADFFVDDINIVYTKDGEQAPVITGSIEEAPAQDRTPDTNQGETVAADNTNGTEKNVQNSDNSSNADSNTSEDSNNTEHSGINRTALIIIIIVAVVILTLIFTMLKESRKSEKSN